MVTRQRTGARCPRVRNNSGTLPLRWSADRLLCLRKSFQPLVQCRKDLIAGRPLWALQNTQALGNIDAPCHLPLEETEELPPPPFPQLLGSRGGDPSGPQTQQFGSVEEKEEEEKRNGEGLASLSTIIKLIMATAFQCVIRGKPPPARLHRRPRALSPP